ncbi:MAG: hypothetical protein COY40_02805 [Alphaproteobacteria bacterium CG_4_10_14_0_8_um_filter_53_9]|nr:MAG: hypothetical protein COY40_02805 [Alphaproteobacteria bacterium CG_4_10_14_0_8_um_filter_53_9]
MLASFKPSLFVHSPRAESYLFLLAAFEAAFLPVGIEMLLIPLLILSPEKTARLALIATAGAVCGAIGGFILGALLNVLMTPGLSALGWLTAWQGVQTFYADFDAVVVLSTAFSPLPLSVVTIGSGVLGADPAQVVMACLIARAARYGFIAWILWRGGARQQEWLERNFFAMTMVASLALLVTFVFVKYLIMVS